MPYGEPDPHDPNLLVGVRVAADLEAVREMAYTIAEEFALLGFSEERLMALFRQPFYAGPYRAYTVLGEDEIAAIVRESLACWGRLHAHIQEAGAEARPRQTPLIQIGERRGGEQRTTGEEGE